MKAYNGGSIGNFLKNLKSERMYVTDTPERATRYANAQATLAVSAEYAPMAEGTVVLEVECEPKFVRRSDNHSSLDTCEAIVNEYKITKATVRFHEYSNTLYGDRHTGYKNREQVLHIFATNGIEVEVK